MSTEERVDLIVNLKNRLRTLERECNAAEEACNTTNTLTAYVRLAEAQRTIITLLTGTS